MLLTLSNTDKKAIIDDEDYSKVAEFTWRLKRAGPGDYYVATSIREDDKCKTLYLHRLIMKPQKNQDVHHKNGFLDNRREQLEKQNSYIHRNRHLYKYRNYK